MAAGTRWNPKDKRETESKMEMTPMIDVTFLLLIFFLCTIKFKILEGKIGAHLPKDVGVNPSTIEDQLEKIEIIVRRVKAVDVSDKEWVWHQDQIEIQVGKRVMSDLREFHDVIDRVHTSNPEMKATFYPEPGTLYIDAVKVINECLRCDFHAITFGGVSMDA